MHAIQAFKQIYGPVKLKKIPEKDLHIRDAGGNDPISWSKSDA